MREALTNDDLLSSEDIFERPPSEPLLLAQQWLEQAKTQQVKQPGALALATHDDAGHVSNRIVQIISIGQEGIVFTSHAQSQKGRDIAATGWASGLFYWRETKQQIILSGPVEKLSPKASDELWDKRPSVTYPMSVASTQSAILDDADALLRWAGELEASGKPLARPDTWLGYVLKPVNIEFWQASTDRLHKRLRYDYIDHCWTSRRLQP